jgi:hypothetical protein
LEEPQSNECFPTNQTFSRYELDLVSYTCGYVDTPMDDRGEKFHRKGAYSESATLLFGTGEQVKQIFIDSDKVRLNNIHFADQQNKSC